MFLCLNSHTILIAEKFKQILLQNVDFEVNKSYGVCKITVETIA